MTNKAISVIIPVYNGAEFLAQALASVLAQTYPIKEIIVINDGSTDCTEAVALSYGAQIVYQSQAQKGAASARNQGLKLAQGEYIAFLDADDLCESNRLELQLTAFAEEPDLDMVFGHARQFISPEFIVHDGNVMSRHGQTIPGFFPGAMMIRKSSFYRVGFFEPTLKLAYFLEWYGRAKEAGLKTKMLPQVVLHRRIHRLNLGLREKSSFTPEHTQVLKALLDQRRLKQGSKVSSA